VASTERALLDRVRETLEEELGPVAVSFVAIHGRAES
jgi:hypothetical protein